MKKNINTLSSNISQNIQSISDSVLSFEQNEKDILEIIGKQFETDSTGKPTIEGMKNLSKAMEIYSDKHFETARYLFIKDGIITRHIAVSSQTPSSTVIKPDKDFLFTMKTYAKETGSQVVFLHNHPSGYVEPSDADIELTEYLNNFFTEPDGTSYFSGHIILDHGTFGLYDAKKRNWNALIDDKIFPLEELQKHYEIQLSELGTLIEFNKNRTIAEQSVIKLAELAKKCDEGNVWNNRDWIPAFLMTGNGVVISLEYINVLEFQNESVLSEKLKSIGREFGSENIVFLPQQRQQFLMCERFAQDTGKVREVIYQNTDGTFELSRFSNGNIFNDLRIDDIIKEDSEQNKNLVKEKILYEQSVNKNINNKKENNEMTEMKNEDITVENSSAKMNPKDVATNYVLEKLSKAGIEVVTDKEEFDRILESENILQKMDISEKSELFSTKNPENLEFEIDSVSIADINLQNKFINITSETPFIFKDFGLDNYPINIYKQKLARALFLEKEKFGERLTHGHKGEFSEKEVKAVFKNIGNPRYIFNSKYNMENPEHFYLVSVYDEFDRNGNPMMLSLHYNKNRKEVEANWITSIYGKDLNLLVNDWVKKGLLVYKNDMELEKASEEVVALYMRVSNLQKPFVSIVRNKSDYVNNMDIIFYKTGDTTYGFTHNGKIYLNPGVMNSEAAVHEYTHLWDAYTQKTNPELWQKGLNILKDTNYWKEVINDPNYQDIKDDENLVLSEIHGRICGKMAEKVLEKIAELDGEQAKFDAIDWNREVNEFIAEEFGIKPELGTENYISDSIKASQLHEFLSAPMKDLFINERELKITNKVEQENKIMDSVENQSKEQQVSEKTIFNHETVDRKSLSEADFNEKEYEEEYDNFIVEPAQNDTSLSGARLRSDFMDNLKEARVLQKNGDERWHDFESLVDNITRTTYTESQQEELKSYILSYTESDSIEEALPRLEKFVDTNIAIDNGALWEYDEKHRKVLKEDGSYHVDYFNNIPVQQLTGNNLSEHLVKNFKETHHLENEVQQSHRQTSSIENTFKNAETEQIEELYEQTESLNQSDLEISDLNKKSPSETKKEDLHKSFEYDSELLKENTELLKQKKQFEKMLERLTNEITSLRKENEAIKQQVFADKKQQSAQDSLFHDSHQENQVENANNEVLLNPDGFGRATAYKVDAIVPKFGIYNKNNEIEFIENARFSKFIENKVSPGYGNVILEIPQKDGKTVEYKMDEKDYNKLINAVDDLERMKQHTDPNSYEWQIIHSNYMAKLNLDENIYRLNSAENFLHNFRIQCRHNNAHNPKQALKIAGIMFEQMPPLDRERHLSERRQYEKIHGKGSYDLRLVKEYEENHGKININIDNIQKEIFNQEKIEEDMGVIYKTLKSGDEIENTKIKVGDSIPIAMTIKSSVNQQKIKLETQDWKIMSVQKGLNRNQAVLYNEAAKSYQTVPLKMLVNHIHKIEKSQAKEKQKRIKKQHKDVEMSL